jgi:hypothetical protein
MLASRHETSVANARTYQSAAAPAAHNDNGTRNLPALNEVVTASSLGVYHWEPDCPLATMQSLRKDHRGYSPRHQGIRLSRREAELRGYRPCPYCEEIEYWRGIQSSHANTLH